MKNITSKFILLYAIAGLLFINATQPKPKPKVKAKAKAKTEVKANPVTKPKAEPEYQLVEISTIYGKMIFMLYNETVMHKKNFISLVEKGFYDSLLFHRVIPSFMIQGGDPLSKYAPAGIPLGNGDIGYRIPAEFYNTIIHKRGALAAARDDNPEKASSACQFYIVQGKTYTVNELTNLRNSVNYSMKTKMLQDVTKSDSVKAKVDDYVLRGDKDGLHAYMLGLQKEIDVMYSKEELDYTPYQMSVYTKTGGAPHLDMKYTVFGQLVEGFNVLDSLAAVKTGPGDRPLTDLRMKIKLLK